MKIIVLNGSPKGEVSTTVQYVKYLANHFEEHTFEILSVAHGIRKLENDETEWGNLLQKVKGADVILWAFPLYILSVHAAYKRFIELIFERSTEKAFAGKYTAALSTSIKFFDYTAHEYIHGICDDLCMNYCGYHSAHMIDLLEEKEQLRLELFFRELIEMKKTNEPTVKTYPKLDESKCIAYKNEKVSKRAQLGKRRAVIVTDAMDEGNSLTEMVMHLKQSFEPEADVINLSQIKMSGGCTGCLRCGYNNICMYDGKDDVRPTYEKIKEYDIIIYAGGIRDRYLSSLWKQFYDRRFFNTHQPMFTGRQVGFLISGPLSQLTYLSHALTSFVHFDDANLSGVVTDEVESAEQLSKQIEGLAKRMVRQSHNGYIQSMPGPAVTGRMVFRDHVWGGLRFVFQGDHKYYKKHKWYDFPHKNRRTRFMTSVMVFMLRFKFFREHVQKNMKTLMIRNLAPIAKKK